MERENVVVSANVMPLPVPPAFFHASGPIAPHAHRPFMSGCLARPPSASSLALADGERDERGKPRILCLHGGYQSGSVFSNKIAGARRKLAREYELDFLDGPISMPRNEDEGNDDNTAIAGDSSSAPRSWWRRNENGQHVFVREAFEYVVRQPDSDKYEAILGFSQGGTLATALALSGALPNVRAVVTSGAPYTAAAFEVASEFSSSPENGFEVPKFHFAGETDAVVPAASTRALCDKGGNGTFALHDQGHLFPTRAARVREVLYFLQMALS